MYPLMSNQIQSVPPLSLMQIRPPLAINIRGVDFFWKKEQGPILMC